MAENDSIRRTSLIAGVAGIAGVLMIGMSFGINTGPPIGASEEQLIAFAATHSRPVLWGAWLQSVGPLLIMGFALTLVHLAKFHNRISGSLTILGGSILMMVSLAEVVCYMAALDAVPSSMGLIGNAVGHVIQHLYFIVAAPAVFVPLGVVIRGSRVLPRAFGTLAILLGALRAWRQDSVRPDLVARGHIVCRDPGTVVAFCGDRTDAAVACRG